MLENKIYHKYCIIIPAYNAADTISDLIKVIYKLNPSLKIFVVDDGSTDCTFDNAKTFQQVSVYKHDFNRGKGEAIRTGIKEAKSSGFHYAIFIDADLQHDPHLIEEFILIREQKDVDLVLGKRSFLKTKMPFHRILSNSITSFMISLRTGLRVHDSQCGYRLVNISKVPIENLKESGFQFESEFLIKMLSSGLKYCEIPIPTIYDKSASSINNLIDTIKFIRLFLKSYLWI
ncbi:MAG: glycosyltransferase family 2 protein [Candidatus Marinimicrobia bacterium]|nr:glycosyltransferase family 2 protein [Candidatus Neomarinimicrobiota bacterium]